MTAVEFAIEKLAKFIPSGNQLVIHIILQEAKELEKQQITDGYSKGKTNGMDISHPFSLTKEISAEQYYNETFNK